MVLILCIVEEINKCSDSRQNMLVNSSYKQTKEYFLHLLLLLSSPLGDRGDPLGKVAQMGVTRHCLEAPIKFCGPDDFRAPDEQMVFEHTLMNLMQDVRQYASEDIGVWKRGPELLRTQGPDATNETTTDLTIGPLTTFKAAYSVSLP